MITGELVIDSYVGVCVICSVDVFFFQAEDGIRDLVRSRGLGDVYKRQLRSRACPRMSPDRAGVRRYPCSATPATCPASHRLSLIHI